MAYIRILWTRLCDATDRLPPFAYVAPYLAQAKDPARTYLKHLTQGIPGAEANESALRMDLPGSRRIRLYGDDNYNRMRGIYLDGVVLDMAAQREKCCCTSPPLAVPKVLADGRGLP
jgi:phage terminase large subunit